MPHIIEELAVVMPPRVAHKVAICQARWEYTTATVLAHSTSEAAGRALAKAKGSTVEWHHGELSGAPFVERINVAGEPMPVPEPPSEEPAPLTAPARRDTLIEID